MAVQLLMCVTYSSSKSVTHYQCTFKKFKIFKGMNKIPFEQKKKENDKNVCKSVRDGINKQ